MVLTEWLHTSIVPQCLDLADVCSIVEQGRIDHLTSIYLGCGHSVRVSSNKDVEVDELLKLAGIAAENEFMPYPVNVCRR